MTIKDKIMPLPQTFSKIAGIPLKLGVTGRANYRINCLADTTDPVVADALEHLEQRLQELLNASPGQADAAVTLELRLDSAPAEMPNSDQGYSLRTTKSSVTVSGYGPVGLSYGVNSLLQCLEMTGNRLELPQIKITDWPAMKTRGHFMESRYGSNLMTLADWKFLVDDLHAMKINTLIVSLYGCWCVQYDGRVSEYLYVPSQKYPELKTPVVLRYYSPQRGGWVDEEQLPPMFEEDFFGELAAYAKNKGMTVMPLFNSFGHNTLIPATYPQVSAKDEAGQASLTGFCTAEDQTYELLFGIYDEIIDNYLAPHNLDSFSVGLDEVWDGLGHNALDIYKLRSPWCKCAVCREKSRETIFIDHAIKLIKHLKKRGMKNIYMYHDMLIRHGGHMDEDIQANMRQALIENDLVDEVVIEWWTYSAHQDGLMFQTIYPDMGLRRTVKPWNGYYHWTVLTDALPNIRLLANIGSRDGAEGMISYSAWDKSYDKNHLGLADFSWNHKAAESENKVREHYSRVRFAAQYDKALQALQLMDWLVEDRRFSYGDGTAASSNYSLLLHTLSYYFYSYVREGKPYPRHFPGEAVQQILAGRADLEPRLHSLRQLAKEAVLLWREIASDQRCDTKMAARLAYEANNFLCLLDDYLALLKMIDLNAAACSDSYQKIARLAGERKLARLNLMAEMEQVKENFLHASHLRNHSIFMQYFADLEAYLTGEDKTVKLDFTDNTHFASPNFWLLR